MIVNLSAQWRVRSDPLQWIVEQHVPGAREARHQWKARAYCKSLDGAVVWAARRQIVALPGDYGPDALPPLCEALDAIVNEVRAALEQVKTSESAAATVEQPSDPPNTKRRHPKKTPATVAAVRRGETCPNPHKRNKHHDFT